MIMVIKKLLDNSGRRSGTDRRKFSYSAHIPELRSGEDRRKDLDRRRQRREQTKHINDKELEKKQAV
jgi:hypothetical protein